MQISHYSSISPQREDEEKGSDLSSLQIVTWLNLLWFGQAGFCLPDEALCCSGSMGTGWKVPTLPTLWTLFKDLFASQSHRTAHSNLREPAGPPPTSFCDWAFQPPQQSSYTNSTLDPMGEPRWHGRWQGKGGRWKLRGTHSSQHDQEGNQEALLKNSQVLSLPSCFSKLNSV